MGNFLSIFCNVQLSSSQREVLKSILISLGKKAGEVDQFIEKAIKNDRIKNNLVGNLTWLDLSYTKLTGMIPSSIGKLTNLTYLDLGNNNLTGVIPDSIFQLTNLTTLGLGGNNLTGVIPSSIGMLTKLTVLNLGRNNLTGVIPDSIFQLTNLTTLDLGGNNLSGEIPSSIDQLSNLTRLDLENNPSLTGHLPVTPNGCRVYFKGTGISSVSVKVKKLRKDLFYLDYWLVMLYIVLGYADLVSDIFAIRELFAVDRIEVGILNILFLVMNVLLGLLTARSMQDAFITVFQLGGLIEGVKTIISGEQTTELVAGKKLDAVARSMPSMVLQLFTLLISLSTITDQSYTILAVSIGLGALGSATTLASMAPKSGRHLFKSRFFIHIAYYFSELLLRIIIISIMFLSIRAVAFVVVGVDWLVRLYVLFDYFDKVDFSLGILYFGSDDAISLKVAWFIGYIINIIELFIFLVVINTFETDDLDILREENTARNITIISCIALLAKTVMYCVIRSLPNEKEDEYTTPGKEGTDDIIAAIADAL